MNCIVFSRDRAMQLDAFLQSVDRHVEDMFTSVTVLYRPTTDRFERAYDALAAERPSLGWRRENDFRTDLLRSIAEAETTVFHTDDDLYFRPPGSIDLREDEVCFTLRLGLNTTYCYPLDLEEELVGATVEGDRVSWDWRTQGVGAFSYPLALNGHVFRTEQVRTWLSEATYANPNELENALQSFNDRVEPRMASPRHNVVVSVPANLVNETFPNRHAASASVDDLNARFLLGERIDIERMDFSAIRACHQELQYVYRHAAATT